MTAKTQLQRLMAGNNRGQLILISALVIGFVLIGLVTVFNSGIVIERLSSEPVTRDTDEMQDTVDIIRRESARLILRVNNAEHGAASGEMVRNGVQDMTSLFHDVRGGTDGATTQLTGVSVTEGYSIRQTNRGVFNDKTGDVNWRAGTFDSIRRLQFSLDVNSLPNLGQGAANDQSHLRSNTFYLLFQGSDGNEFRVYFFRRGGDAGVATQTNNGPINQYLQPANGMVDIGVATGTIAGVHHFDFDTTLTPPYTVNFRNGNEPSGIYTMTVDGNIDTASVNAKGNGQPYYTRAAYSATFDVTYFDSSMQYSDSIRVAPCSIWDTHCYPGGDAGDV